MSTGNDTVLPIKPADNQQQQQIDTTAAAPAEAVFVVPPAVVDVDDIELNEAKAAVLAEEAGGKAEGQGGAAPGEPTGQQQQAAPKDQQQPAAGAQPAAEPTMIPYARFVEVNSAKSEAERVAAYWRGIAEARGTPAPAAQPAQTQQTQTVEPPDPLKALRDEKKALAKRYDGGELSMEDYEAQRDALDDKATSIREEQLLARVPKAAAPAQGASDALYLETLTAQLEIQHPWVVVFDQVATNSEWELLRTRAIDNCAARGVDPTKGDLGRYELRKEIAKLADELGHALIGKRATEKGIALPGAQASQGQQQQQQQQQPPRVPQAQARLDAMVKAAGAPPDISNLAGNGAGDPGGVPSDAHLERMSDEEINALPVSVRNRLKGIEAA